MAEHDDDRLGKHSRGADTGPIRRYRDEDRGENPADHLCRGDEDLASRLGGTDTGALRSQDNRGRGPKGNRGSDERTHEDTSGRQAIPRDRDQPPLYEGATSISGIGGLDAGMGSAGVSGLSGGPAGSTAMGTTGGRSGADPGVTSTTGAGFSTMTGTGRTGGPASGSDEDQKDRAQPPQSEP
jgi:hypothetical protein